MQRCAAQTVTCVLMTMCKIYSDSLSLSVSSKSVPISRHPTALMLFLFFGYLQINCLVETFKTCKIQHNSGLRRNCTNHYVMLAIQSTAAANRCPSVLAGRWSLTLQTMCLTASQATDYNQPPEHYLECHCSPPKTRCSERAATCMGGCFWLI